MGLRSCYHKRKIITIREYFEYFCFQHAAHKGGRSGGFDWEAGAGKLLWQECWPVISTRGWSDSEKETEWKLASEVTWRGETPMHRTGTTGIPHPQPELRSSRPTALLTFLTIGIFLLQTPCGKREEISHKWLKHIKCFRRSLRKLWRLSEKCDAIQSQSGATSTRRSEVTWMNPPERAQENTHSPVSNIINSKNKVQV